MTMTGNNIHTSQLAALAQRAGPDLTATIQKASLKTGVDFSYMMEKAAAESNFDTDAQARTSSARGMYQFIESTWLQMVNRYGDRYGLGEYADQINDKGKVSSPALRKEILALRDDPEIASLMAGEFASENKRTLVRSGIPAEQIGSTELYLAHFLGAGAASQFIKGMNKNPLTPAADIFPKAAAANKNVFYNSKTQAARSFGEIYAFFDKKFDSTPGTGPGPAPSGQNQPVLTAGNENNKPLFPVDTKTQGDIKAQAGAIAALSPLRVFQPQQQMNQIHHDLTAWMNGGNIIDDQSFYIAQQTSKGSGQGSAASAALPGANSLVSDPVALMLLANLDLRETPKLPAQKDDKDEDQRTASAHRKALEDCMIPGFH